MKYTYHKNTDEGIAEEILEFYARISSEKNTIIDGWKSLDLKVENALQSQAMLYHYKNYCVKKDCLNCEIGLQILKNN